MLTFRSYLGRQFDRGKGAASQHQHSWYDLQSSTLCLSCRPHKNEQVMQRSLSAPIATAERKSRSYGDRKVTGKDTYAAETLTWRLATLEMEMQHGSTGGASVPRGCIQECRLGQS